MSETGFVFRDLKLDNYCRNTLQYIHTFIGKGEKYEKVFQVAWNFHRWFIGADRDRIFYHGVKGRREFESQL